MRKPHRGDGDDDETIGPETSAYPSEKLAATGGGLHAHTTAAIMNGTVDGGKSEEGPGGVVVRRRGETTPGPGIIPDAPVAADDDDDDDDKPPLLALARALEALNAATTPARCRFDPARPPAFTLRTNVLLGLGTTFTVANLYYPQPVLNVIAADFGVADERASSVAALSQAGYAVGLLLICPLGDLVPRRPGILLLVLATATMWIGLCLTNSFNVFLSLSFLCGVGTVTPQLMLPLVGDLAPPNRRAASLSIVVSGLALGLLIARVLSGIVANFTSWRNIYWLALGAQYLTFILLFFTLPDYPTKNTGLGYFKALWRMLVMVVREPLLTQACIIGFLLSAAFTNFWTTLTFLLASPPYNYTSLQIGLFALIGVATIALAPVWSRLITDRFVFLFSVVAGLAFELIGVVLGTFLGRSSVAGPVVQAVMMDTGANFTHTANRSNVYRLDPRARNRVNTAYMVCSFAGQLTGTAAGNRLYARGGWVWSGSLGIALIGAGVAVGLARGPRETGWVGWQGGWGIRRRREAREEKETMPTREEAAERGDVPLAAPAEETEEAVARQGSETNKEPRRV